MLIDEPHLGAGATSMQQSPSFKKMESLENGDLANSQGYGLTRLNSADHTHSNASVEYK